jgi:hypothetical protein
VGLADIGEIKRSKRIARRTPRTLAVVCRGRYRTTRRREISGGLPPISRISPRCTRSRSGIRKEVRPASWMVLCPGTLNVYIALEAYETAANWFESDNAEALSNKLYLKVADLAALEANYPKAIENFERVATSSVNVRPCSRGPISVQRIREDDVDWLIIYRTISCDGASRTISCAPEYAIWARGCALLPRTIEATNSIHRTRSKQTARSRDIAIWTQAFRARESTLCSLT